MTLRSVRSRLTGLVCLAVLLLGIAAATVGVSRVEANLVDDAVDVAAENQLFIADMFVSRDDMFGTDDVGKFGDVDAFARAMELDNLLLTLADVRDSGYLDRLREAIGDTDTQSIAVLTNFGEILSVDIETLDIDGPREPADIQQVVVPQTALDELAFATFEFEFDDLFIDSDEIAELSGKQGPQIDDETLEFAVVERDSVEYAVLADTSDVVRSVDNIRQVVWLAVPLATMAAAAVAWFLTGRALRPVSDITSRVGGISRHRLHERVPEPRTGDEIAELARTMNAMLERLDADDQRLRQFVSDAGHELRSPVAVLRSEAEVAAAQPDRTTVDLLAHGVLGETERLQRIVDDLLVLALGDERSAIALRDVDVDDIVLAEAARSRRLPVTTSGVSAGRIRGTTDGVARVVTHLLDNATRHGDTEVAVTLIVSDDAVVLTVDDDGPGIAPADRDRVFERFVRLDEARSRDRGGAGLGLAVVAETVRTMHGSVRVEDSDLGGARFVVEWPRTQ